MINSNTPLDVIISNQKFLIVPNKTAFYCYLAFTVQLFSFHFFFFLGYAVLHNAFFFPEIQHDGSVSNTNFPIFSG